MLDAVVIGGGPAGATVATLLASKGLSVRVVERERFPRPHVGESLLPCAVPVLERLGMDMSEHLVKHGAEFLDESQGGHARFAFADGYPGFPERAWQVDRPLFDARLGELAAQAGAQISWETRVRHVELGTDRVRVNLESGEELDARYLIDATGQATFLARRHGSLTPCHAFGRAAAFAQFRGLAPEVRSELEETGNIIILLVPDGWAWLIPLAQGKLSVGFVSRGKISPETFSAGVAASPLIQRLTRGAEHDAVRQVGDFSYANTRPHGARFACIGDAACFLDPVFSSGVSLALLGAERLADLLAGALDKGREGEPGLLDSLSADLDRAYATFAAFIHRFYNTRLVPNLFFAEDPDPDIHRGIVGVLAGDLWREDNPFQAMLLKPGRRGFSWPPEELAGG